MTYILTEYNTLGVPIMCTERKGVSFIETSALDSTNVEKAFMSLLTGKYW